MDDFSLPSVNAMKVVTLADWKLDNHITQHIMSSDLNPLHPKISKHILHTVLYTFLKIMKRRNISTLVGDMLRRN